MSQNTVQVFRPRSVQQQMAVCSPPSPADMPAPTSTRSQPDSHPQQNRSDPGLPHNVLFLTDVLSAAGEKAQCVRLEFSAAGLENVL